MLTWDAVDERYYSHGLDRGVLYLPLKGPVAWNGLTGFDEGESGASSVLYRDGRIYMADVDASDFSGKLTALFFPDEFSECLGIPEVTDGLYVDNQKPKRFDFSYRSLVGSGTAGDMFGYQIHLVYNAVASIGSRSRKSISSSPTPVDFNFDLVCTPVQLPGYRPSAHYIIDTRHLDPSTVSELEAILYGSGATSGRMPTPTELFELLNFGDAITVTIHTGDLAGFVTIEGSYENVHALDSASGYVNNINAVVAADGTVTISDGGNTTIVTE